MYEESRDGFLLRVRGDGNGSRAIFPWLVDRRSRLSKRGDDPVVAVQRCSPARRPPSLVLSVDVGAQLEEELGGVDVAGLRCNVERRSPSGLGLCTSALISARSLIAPVRPCAAAIPLGVPPSCVLPRSRSARRSPSSRSAFSAPSCAATKAAPAISRGSWKSTKAFTAAALRLSLIHI